MEKIDCLDHGFVRLVDFMGDDLSVVRAARVSFDAAWRAGENEGSDARLIRYLWKNRHTSPFESVEFQFEVKAPIFVFRQWHRHRTWCLAADARLIFERPNDQTAFPMAISDLVRKWNPRHPKRQRHDRTLADFNRERFGSMRLRGPAGAVHVTNAWHSGAKRTFTVETRLGCLTVSEDHLFKTPNGQARIKDGLTYVMALTRAGDRTQTDPAPYAEQELAAERWVEFADGYEVSDLGRVRSYWRQGARTKRAAPALKAIVTNLQGRAVVSVGGGGAQVSVLVANAFLGASDAFVLHRDDNPLNNRLSNLRYGTAADNSADQYVNGGRVRLREVPVRVESVKDAGEQDTFDITVTGDHWFCASNLVVHNSFNELSARYTELPEEFYVPAPENVAAQSTSNKQGRGEALDDFKADLARARIGDACEAAFKVYRNLLDNGVARELARSVLPVATYSHMFAKVDLRNLLGFLDLRCHSHAQFEIRVYAEAMRELAKSVAPVCMAAWEESRTS